MTATPITPSPGTAWAVVVPVKRLAIAKTRLTQYAGSHRTRLALAFAADTVAAALASPAVAGVVVVTDDTEVAALVTKLGALVVADEPADGLNPALIHGANVAVTQFPGAPLAAVSSDVPSLRTNELTLALTVAERFPAAFVSDAEGVGTTMFTARTRLDFVPRFGHRSRAAHRQAGVVELTETGLTSVRRDVDTEVDLYDAGRLGLGARSTLALAELDRERSTL